MNKARRKELERAIELLEKATDIIDSCKDEEREYLDNMPENLQYSEKHEVAESAVENLEQALYYLSDAVECVESASE